MDTVLGYFKDNIRLVPLYSTRILRITAELYGGCLLMQQALVAKEKLDLGNQDQDFYSGKIQSAKVYILNIVPDVAATVRVLKKQIPRPSIFQKQRSNRTNLIFLEN